MKIIYKKTLQNREILTIRYPLQSDLNSLCKFMNDLSKEKTYILAQGENISLAEAKQYLSKIIKGKKTKKNITLFLFISGQLTGTASVIVRPAIYNHLGNLNIAIRKDMRGQGLGKLLMETLLKECRIISTLKMIILQVFSNNKHAIELYDRLGFKKYGQLPDGIFYKGHYVDEINMFKRLR